MNPVIARNLVYIFGVLIVFSAGVADADDPGAKKSSPVTVKQTLRERCLASIESSEVPAKRTTLKETAMDLGSGHYMFEFKQPDGGSFFCQICDETNRSIDCGTLGLRLSHRPASG